MAPNAEAKSSSYPWWVRAASWWGAYTWRSILGLSSQIHVDTLDEQPAILCCWHRSLLFSAYAYRQLGLGVIVSEHRDGELVAQSCSALGMTPLRGSSTRGGAKALVGALRHLKAGRPIGLTPDGPKGPIYSIHPGVIHLAQKSGLPIRPVGLAIDRCFEINSWDRFQLPKPGASWAVCLADAIHIPAECSREDYEMWKQRIHDGINAAGEAAQAWIS